MWLLAIALAVLVLAAGALSMSRAREDEDESEPSGDTRPPVDLLILESPDGKAKITLEYMDAERWNVGRVMVRLDRSFDGVTSLQGVGASAFFSLDGRFLIFHQPGAIAALDYRTKTARHLLPPSGLRFAAVRLEGDRLRVELRDGEERGSSMEPVPLVAPDARWKAGLADLTTGDCREPGS